MHVVGINSFIFSLVNYILVVMIIIIPCKDRRKAPVFTFIYYFEKLAVNVFTLLQILRQQYRSNKYHHRQC